MVFSLIQIEIDYVLHRMAECTLPINMSKRINKVVQWLYDDKAIQPCSRPRYADWLYDVF